MNTAACCFLLIRFSLLLQYGMLIRQEYILAEGMLYEYETIREWINKFFFFCVEPRLKFEVDIILNV